VSGSLFCGEADVKTTFFLKPTPTTTTTTATTTTTTGLVPLITNAFPECPSGFAPIDNFGCFRSNYYIYYIYRSSCTLFFFKRYRIYVSLE